MTRCHSAISLAALALFSALFAAAPLAVQAQTTENIIPLAYGRTLPQASLRGKLMLTNPPDVALNGEADKLAPGFRIRGANNLLVMVGAAIGNEYVVNYTRDSYGLIQDVWILREDEAAQTWPKTAEEAAKWAFDPLTRTWTK
jgi:hypothetical protein